MMTKKWQPYPTYKDSGVEWLGAIPEHWKVKKLKNVAFINLDTLNEDIQPDYLLTYIDIGNVTSDGSILETQEFQFKQAPSRARRKVKNGDTIISTVRTYLRAISLIKDPPENLIVSTGFAVLSPRAEIDSRFLFRFVQSSEFVEKVVAHSEGVGYPAINPSKLACLPIWLPPLPEQQKIAEFLDQETSKIDKLITKKERLIELLKEKRTALISHAVTKGLNPDVPMKDSGVEWLGKIPEHWKVKRLKFLTRQIIDGTHFTPTYAVEGVPFLRVTDIQESVINFEQVKLIPESEHKELIKRCNPEKGDLLLSKNGTIGVPRIVDWNHKFSIFVSLCLIKVRKLLSVHYSYYFFLSHEIKSQMSYGTKTNTVMNLHLDKIREFIFTFPPLPEQQKIAQFLDRETSKIDNLITKTRTSIDHLKEYRTALISAAVTGKIDVREH
ncbi:restriction endonuclease subunit S [Microcystis aeruginosa LEGE 11464]|uniref:restriction endonuclease subunit S n=1 Tax=Microcystis aeruginosa TaxID=1126 RepID=UPI00187FB805|nr:restriction endonuclease subunit S [Microcystis aeruginosa]MBE9091127.1 restriction endonuclease subunit S [Microcystis aeruginosa LEGE 11464]